MSENPELVVAVWSVHIAGSCIFAATTLVLYDILLTFSQEVACVWRRKWNLVTLLFAVCRYGTLVDVMLKVQGGFGFPHSIIRYDQ
ncbi:unnamed protein product [Somion occarium]|uniref:DUF6533 domain-containing protein n=1 Tax=Somion occarium TaxID=3059160 RepID=A0ABP1CPL4_9APHY